MFQIIKDEFFFEQSPSTTYVAAWLSFRFTADGWWIWRRVGAPCQLSTNDLRVTQSVKCDDCILEGCENQRPFLSCLEPCPEFTSDVWGRFQSM